MRFTLLVGAVLMTALGTGAQAQSYYGPDRILEHYDPFDTIPGAEIQGGLGAGLPPAPARPLVLGYDGVPVYAATNPLLPGPQYVDPRAYGQLRLSPYERRLYFAKDPAAYARRHAYDAPQPRWRGEATNPVVASTGIRVSERDVARAYAAAIQGRGRPGLPPGPDDLQYLPRR